MPNDLPNSPLISASLQPFPGDTLSTDIAITAELRRFGNALEIQYVVTGRNVSIRYPGASNLNACGMTDRLWEHTCFELFVAPCVAQSAARLEEFKGGPPVIEPFAYREFNFSSSGDWAMYDFKAYRERSIQPQPIERPVISSTSRRDATIVCVTLPASLLPSGALLAGVTAVIEDIAGNKTYWALSHPGSQPDFHVASAFTLVIPQSPQSL